MADFARSNDLDVNQIRQAGKDLKEMSSAYRELAIDGTLAAAGVIPGYGWAADVVSLGRSISKGDGWGVLFDVIGFILVFGDAAKGARVVDKLNTVRRVLDQTLSGLTRVFAKTEDVSASFWRSRRNMTAYNDALKSCSTQKCLNDAARLKGPQYGKTPRTGGNWFPPEGRGDGIWTPDPNSSLGKFLSEGSPPRTSIEYENGFPKFDDFSQADVKIPMTGNYAADFDIADDLYRRQLDDPNWTRPRDMTWHHKEDGVTMQLVPNKLNLNAGHMGGAALFREGKAVGDDF